MAHDPLIGSLLANFRIERLIGQGGMAQVYFGHDVKLRRPVAIKVIDARYRGNVAYAERFVREAQTVATWRHENILQVYYADEEAGLYYFVMEYIDGLDLARLIAQYRSEGELMPHQDVARIGRAIANALDYAHAQGVIHRDVKPSNVMVASDGRVVLADFGLAMDAEQGSLGEVFGTPHYIAPEQARRSADAVPQSDLYALGVILYEMLTGVVPFDDPSAASLALQHLTLPPPPPREFNPDLSPETEQVLLKALSKSPAERYQTGASLIDAVERSLQTTPRTADEAREAPPPAVLLSHMTVADRVARHLSAAHTPTAYPEPFVAHTKQRGSVHTAGSAVHTSVPGALSPHGGVGILVAGAVAALVVIGGLLLYLVLGGGGHNAAPPISPPASLAAVAQATGPETSTMTSSPEPSATPGVTEVATEVVAVAPLPGATDTATLPPTLAPTLTRTATVLPSATPTLTLTATALPTLAPTFTLTASLPPTSAPTEPPAPTPTLSPPPAQLSTATPIPPPTVLYPNGQHFMIYYNQDSLYVHNLSNERVPLQPIAFDRLDASGNPTNHFDGGRWAQFYGVVYPQACAKLIILDPIVGYLEPPQCQSYNSEVWVERGRSLDFWTPQDGSMQFRVLWNGQEVGRCEIATGSCEVFLP
jgi:serine/threonine protein kinase